VSHCFVASRHMLTSILIHFFFSTSYREHRELHSFPTRRSSDLEHERVCGAFVLIILDVHVLMDVRERDVFERLIGMTPKDTGASDRKSTRLNSSHVKISYAVFCLKKKK